MMDVVAALPRCLGWDVIAFDYHKLMTTLQTPHKNGNGDRQRILICSAESILGAAAKELLALDHDLEVIEIPDDDIECISHAISINPPTLVILVEGISNYLTTQIQQILSDFPGTKLITLSLDDNWIHIFLEKRVLLTQGVDLPKVIRSLGKEGCA